MLLFNIIAVVGLTVTSVGAVTISGSTTSNTGSTAGIEALVKRRLPQHENSFTFSLFANTGSESESYSIMSTRDGKIQVQGTSLSAIVYG